MRKLITVLSSLALLLSLAGSAMAAPPAGKGKLDGQSPKTDNLPSAIGKKQAALKQRAQELVLKGQRKAVGANMVVEVAKGQYVELAQAGEGQIFTLLGEFGDLTATHDHGSVLGTIDHGGDPGPSHNEIPEPDRSVDNTTIWEPDFSQAYYQDLLFNKSRTPSMANYYLKQSSGRYSVDGYVGPWVEVPYNAAAYGSNYCGSIVCTRDIGRFIEDQADGWYAEMLGTMSAEEVDEFLSEFDVKDRYDFDGDGEFNEPDGYIDAFQSVHAGEGEETGGGAQGEDAIWSHRSYVNSVPFGAGGPPGGPAYGGARIGNSSYWIGDYTIEPENGGVGVFAHEYSHDLGIPDLYDTSGNTGGAENGTGWWTVMSQGSYGTVNGIDLGSTPTDYGVWEKFQVGWLNYDVAFAGVKKNLKLGPAETNTKQAQGLFVVLPDKEVTVDVGDPYAGDYFYHSGAGNDLDNNMTREVTLGAGPIGLSFRARYEIEGCWDYAYVEVSTDGGTTFTSIPTSASTADNENGQNFGNGITGTSGNPKTCDQIGLGQVPSWVAVTADLSAYANTTIQLRFRYWTDGAVVGEGFGVDDIAITGLATDGGESEPGWVYEGFSRTTGSTVVPFFNAYVAEYRQYRTYDKALKLGPYNFVDPLGTEGTPNLVEHFPYQDGLLISYWDSSFEDNNVGDHPGGGLILPIDAHPEIMTWSDGSTARPRIQSYDATFGLEKTDAISLHNYSSDLTLTQGSQAPVSVFDDSQSYWVSGDPGDAPDDGRYQAEWNSVIVPNTGTVIKVVSVSSLGSFMQVVVNP